MKILVNTASAILLAGSTLAWAADCERPEAPSIPDGSKSSEQEMIEGQQQLKEYMAGTEAYLGCIDKEEKARIEVEAKATEDATEADAEEARVERAAAHTSNYNSAVQDMESKAEEFNSELKQYREAQAKAGESE